MGKSYYYLLVKNETWDIENIFLNRKSLPRELFLKQRYSKLVKIGAGSFLLGRIYYKSGQLFLLQIGATAITN